MITDFAHLSDDIDLSTIDANGAAAGQHAFRSSPPRARPSPARRVNCAGSSRAPDADAVTIVEGDINGDKVADFQIQLTGLKTLTAADFVL